EQRFTVVEKYSVDLTELARLGKLDPVVGRDDEIRQVMQTLTRRTKNNPVLIGDAGVGKTAIAEGLAIKILDDDVPDSSATGA
ncbi:Chaperone protein ClpB 2, partial [Geodia barretti]